MSHDDVRMTRLITIGCFFAFFLFGFTDNMKGPTVSIWLKELNLNYTMGGTLLLGSYIGFFTATLFIGMVADRLRKKAVLYIAGVSMIFGITVFILSTAFLILFAAMFFIGIALGSLELGCNSMIVDIHRQNQGRYLNMLSFFHGLGSVIAPFYAGQLLATGFSWRQVYGYSLPLSVIMLLFFLFVKYPSIVHRQSKKPQWKLLRHKAFSGYMFWFYLLIFSYVATELSIGTWAVEFLQKAKGMSLQLSSLMLSLFFGSITLGRLLGSFLVERVGYIRIMTYSMVLSLLSLTAGIFGPPLLSFLIPFSGLFFSIVFPTALAAVSSFNKDYIGIILGLFLSMAGLGGMVGPWVIGVLNDHLGTQIGLSATILFGLISLASLIVLSQNKAPNKGAVV